MIIPENLSLVGVDGRWVDDLGAVRANGYSLRQERMLDSARYRSAHSSALDVPYGAGQHAAWDIFPFADPAAPCLVFIHERYGSERRQDIACVAEGIAAHGWSVAIPGYDAAPGTSLPGIIAELRDALDWLQHHGPAHGIAGRVIISGCGSGAYLAAMLLDHPILTGGIGISGIYEPGPRRDHDFEDRLSPELQFPSPTYLPVVPKEFAIAYGTGAFHGIALSSRLLHAHRADHHGSGVLLPLPGADSYSVFRQLRDPASRLIWHILDLENALNFQDPA